mmetsp:Transcript_4677/g.7604  ORF Transcript_4677/g.7604 Transcript_4677/m.7604 type:complete len:108 (+) Transcript_4677:57-380(+)
MLAPMSNSFLSANIQLNVGIFVSCFVVGIILISTMIMRLRRRHTSWKTCTAEGQCKSPSTIKDSGKATSAGFILLENYGIFGATPGAWAPAAPKVRVCMLPHDDSII